MSRSYDRIVRTIKNHHTWKYSRNIEIGHNLELVLYLGKVIQKT